jgi:hypothetical protein
MPITPEQQLELVKFPLALRMLVDAELAAGNSIMEVGFTFPAPPAGAYIMLANKVSTRSRDSGDGLHFYERNSSSYSGEFTDAKRFYYVIEPPNPPSPEPDLEAVRKSSGSDRNTESATPMHLSVEDSPMGSTRVLYFNDNRPPHEVKQSLERELRSLFTLTMEQDKLCFRAKAAIVGADYDFLLRFEAALSTCNCYSFHMHVSWAGQASSNSEYYRKTSGSWFSLWTSKFIAADRPLANFCSSQGYRQLCDDALHDDKQLDSIAAIQNALITALKSGASFRTSHKEGGTNIYWRNDRFVRSDYGDYPDERRFEDDIEFLRMLRQFYQGEAAHNPAQVPLSEIDTWRLILRRIDPK